MANKQNTTEFMKKVCDLYEAATTELGPAHQITTQLRVLVMRAGDQNTRTRAMSIYRKLNAPPTEEQIAAAQHPKRRRFGVDPLMQTSIEPNRSPLEGGTFNKRQKPGEQEAQLGKSKPTNEQQLKSPAAGDSAGDVLTENELKSASTLKPAALAARFSIERISATITHLGGQVGSDWKGGAQYAAALLRLIKGKKNEASTT